MIMEPGAQAIGCPVIPGGVGNTELQAQAIADLRPAAARHRSCGSCWKRSRIPRCHVVAEACRRWRRGPAAVAAQGNKRSVVPQNHGTADPGLVAYESRAMEGLIVDEGVVFEIVRAGG
jgi:phenylacetate-CoA ligase